MAIQVLVAALLASHEETVPFLAEMMLSTVGRRIWAIQTLGVEILAEALELAVSLVRYEES